MESEATEAFLTCLQQDTVVAIRITEGSALTITNVNPEKYPQQSFKADPSQVYPLMETPIKSYTEDDAWQDNTRVVCYVRLSTLMNTLGQITSWQHTR